MRLSIISIITTLFLAPTVPAAADEPRQPPFDIDAALTAALEEACPPSGGRGDGEATVYTCPDFEWPDYRDALSSAQQYRVTGLVHARAEMNVAQAEATVLAQQFENERLRGDLQALQLEHGIVVPAEEHLGIVTDLEKTITQRQNAAGDLQALIDTLTEERDDRQSEADELRAAMQVLGATVLNVCNDDVAEADEAICDDFEGMVSAPEVVHRALSVVSN